MGRLIAESATLLSLSMLFTGACVAPGDAPPAPSEVPLFTHCGGDAPRCVSSCDEQVTLAYATCHEGDWTCAEGVSTQLCCDPVLTPEHCPTWEHQCSSATPCPGGYTCVHSRNHPIPATTGVCRFGDLSIPDPVGSCSPGDMTPLSLLASLDIAPIKVEGVVQVELMCEDQKRCSADEPCCQRCNGAYRIHLTDELGARVELPLRTQAIACMGNNCGFSCAPMQPGRRYVVWGLFMPEDVGGAPGTLHYAGHCDG